MGRPPVTRDKEVAGRIESLPVQSPNDLTPAMLVAVADVIQPPCAVGITDPDTSTSTTSSKKDKDKVSKNCRNNPNCLHHLGERGWLSGQSLDAEKKRLAEDSIRSLRKPGMFVGLCNLGATCYVNSLLQTWFHNPPLRDAVMKWRPGGPDESDSEAQAMANLQRVFAFLQSGQSQYYNPKHLVDNLQLSHFEQQDAQEFNKLFMMICERQFGSQKDPLFKRLVAEEYRGTYSYQTMCLECRRVSERPSTFYELELNIKGKKTLMESLDEFFQSEQLSGANQYHCANCAKKCDASRRIVLKTLPDVLTLQLLRFVYDLKTYTKRKLTQTIQFPHTMDISNLVGEPKGSQVYDLQAVILHRGQGASSGHYIAHAKSYTNNKWYQFDDESCSQIQEDEHGQPMWLGIDKDEPGKKGKMTPCANGSSTSSGVYMLAYRRRATAPSMAVLEHSVIVPAALQSDVEAANVALHVDIERLQREIAVREAQVVDFSALVCDIYRQFPAPLGPDCAAGHCKDSAFIPTAWIRHWLRRSKTQPGVQLDDEEAAIDASLLEDVVVVVKEPDAAVEVKTEQSGKSSAAPVVIDLDEGDQSIVTVVAPAKQSAPDPPPADLYSPACIGAIDCTPLLCSHGRLRFESIPLVKRIHRSALDRLQQVYGVKNPLIGDEALCLECFRQTFSKVRLASVLKTQQSIVADILRGVAREVLDPADCVWISKQALSVWQHMKAEAETSSQLRPGLPRQNELNHDLLCEHGNLSSEEYKRRLIPVQAWLHILETLPYLNRCNRTLPGLQPVCSECPFMNGEAKKAFAQGEKTRLNDLYVGRNRPTLSALIERPPGDQVVYLVSIVFFRAWREWLRSPEKLPRPSKLAQQTASLDALLCMHGKLHFLPKDCLPENYAEAKARALWRDEWEALSELYPADMEVTLRLEDRGDLVCSHEVCVACMAHREEVQSSAQFNYASAYVNVQRLLAPLNLQDPTAPVLLDEGDADADLALALRASMADSEGMEITAPASAAASVSMVVGDGASSATATPGSTIPTSAPTPAPPLSSSAGGAANSTASNGGGSAGDSAAARRALADDTPLRRSGRSRRTATSKKCKVSATMTLRDLKLWIMANLNGSSPVDQQLYYDQQPLLGDELTLKDLRVPPGATILVYFPQVAAPSGGTASTKKETGFAGTKLIGSGRIDVADSVDDASEEGDGGSAKKKSRRNPDDADFVL
eukprot:m.169625 g.169625  ORF g.169625 m.169625 type:complete len:1216 (+) comp17243_c1_seq1:883-4530(+)